MSELKHKWRLSSATVNQMIRREFKSRQQYEPIGIDIRYGAETQHLAGVMIFGEEPDRTQRAERILRAVNSHDALVDALTLALPYVESALEDQGYKPGVVDRMVKSICAALKLAEENN